eukprot:2137782-Lingulodinium_polyedra.AAC.1
MDPGTKALTSLGHDPNVWRSLFVRFDDVLRAPARARQPRSAICSHCGLRLGSLHGLHGFSGRIGSGHN